MKGVAFFEVFVTVILSQWIIANANNRFRDGRCEEKLLDDKQRVPDSAFSESSAFEDHYRGYAARESYDRESEQYAWCPRQAVGKDLQEYVAIDLGNLRVITHIWTKGRTARGTGSESTQYYHLQYKREVNENEWRTYKHSDLAIGERLRGNLDPTVESIAEISPKIIARYIKILPFNEGTARTVCMKLQIFGCDFEEPFVEYRVPYSQELELLSHRGMPTVPDVTYDGRSMNDPYLGVTSNYPTYSGGLGILSDGFVPISGMSSSEETYREHSFPSLQSHSLSIAKMSILTSRGSGFMTWMSGNGRLLYVDIVFRFPNIYNVTQFHIFVANGGASLAQTRLPLVVEFWMGLDNIAVSPCWLRNLGAPRPFTPDVSAHIPKDTRNISPRWLDFPVAQGGGAAGNFSRIRLHFSNESGTGIAVSEISFTATISSILAVTPRDDGQLATAGLFSVKTSASMPPKSGFNTNEDINAKVYPTLTNPSGGDKTFDMHILVIVSSAVVVCIVGIFIFVVFGCLHRLKRQHHRKKCHLQSGISNAGTTTSCTNGYLHHSHFSQGNIATGYAFPTPPQQQQPLLSSSCAVNYYPTLPTTTTPPRLPFSSPELMPLDPNHKQTLAFLSQMANSTNALCLPFHVSTANPSFSSTTAQYVEAQTQKNRPVTTIGVDNGSLYNSLKTCHTSGGDCNGSDTESGGYHYARGSPHFTEPGVLSYTSHVNNGMMGATPVFHNSTASNLSNVHCDQQLSPSLNHLITSQLSSVPNFVTSQALRYTNCSPNFNAGSPLILTSALCNPMGTLPMPPLNERLSNISIQGVTGSSVYTQQNDVNETLSHTDILTPVNVDHLNIPMIPAEEVEMTTLLNGGDYSQIHLASLRCSKQGLDNVKDFSKAVIVKSFDQTASKKMTAEFVKEIRHLNRLRHHNFAQIIGLCKCRGDSVALRVIMEYSSYGDLHQFLQRHYAKEDHQMGSTLPNAQNQLATRTLSHGTLIYFATQIACAMKYLEQIEMVHRDLACRNCLVGDRYSIKITDVAMCQRQFHADYYHPPVEGNKQSSGFQPSPLPIRWMAYESVLQNIFSPKTDVWSFGITLWEILTFSREQPYAHMSDEKVLDNLRFLSVNDPRGETPWLPPRCPRELSDFIQQCWSRQSSLRPNFHEIHMFLQRKNQGYIANEVVAAENDFSEEYADQVEPSTSLLKNVFLVH